MLSFGLKGLKTVVYVCNFLLLTCAVYLLVSSIIFRTIWNDANHILGNVFTVCGDVTLFLALALLIAVILGFAALINCKLVAIGIYATILGLCIPALIVCGFHLYVEGYSDQSSNYVHIESYIRSMSPRSLNLVQKAFQCCGIEKYTDYFIIWHLWNMNISELKEEIAVPTEATTVDLSTNRTEKTPITPVPPPESRRKYNYMDLIDLKSSGADELDHLFGYYQNPMLGRKEFEGNNSKYSGRAKKIKNWLDLQLTKLKAKISKWININMEYLQQYAPSLTVHAVQSFLKTINNIYKGRNIKEIRLKNDSKQQLTKVQDPKNYMWNLPYSCCKTKGPPRCAGETWNTYKDGCRHRVASYYQRNVFYMAQICLCLVPIVFITMVTVLFFKTGLVEHNAILM